MRKAFIAELTRLAHEDRRIFLLTGDLGFMALEPFRDAHPTRFLNVGVAEQNMIGVATGLAEAGYLPFCYSIATFATMRGYEFIRNGPVAHGLPVKIVGMGGGFEYGTAGHTHHALEDIAIMRALPRVNVIVPADWQQAAWALHDTYADERVTYYRLGKDDTTIVPGLDGRFARGQLTYIQTRHNPSILVLTTGPIATEALEAAMIFEREHSPWEIEVAVVATFDPMPPPLLRAYPLIVTVEEHGERGGLGSAYADLLAPPVRSGSPLMRLAADEGYLTENQTGSQAWLRARHGLDAASLAKALAGWWEVIING